MKMIGYESAPGQGLGHSERVVEQDTEGVGTSQASSE
jgi:hypothetical protein